MDTAWVALVGTVFGGGGFKLIEWWLNRAQVQDKTQVEMREELRTELTAMKAELRLVEADLDRWKEKYFELLERSMKAQIDARTLPPPPGGGKGV